MPPDGLLLRRSRHLAELQVSELDFWVPAFTRVAFEEK